MSKSTDIPLEDGKKYGVPPFYQQFKAHLSSYFKNAKRLEEAARLRNPRGGDFLEKVNDAIKKHLTEEDFDIAALSKVMGLSRSQLYRKINALTRHTPSRYVRFVRLQHAKDLMESEGLTVGEAAFRTGFVNQSHFSRVFKLEFGFHPSHFRQICQNKHQIHS